MKISKKKNREVSERGKKENEMDKDKDGVGVVKCK